MTFQSTVFSEQGFGNIGELYSDAPTVVTPYTLNSLDPSNNVYGRFFTTSSTTEGFAQAGGNQIPPAHTPAGFLINPHSGASYGNSSTFGPLSPTLTLSNGVTAGFLTRGFIIVTIAEVPVGPITMGELVFYNRLDGSLAVMTSGIVFPDYINTNAKIAVLNPNQPGLAVIEVFDVPYNYPFG